LGGRYIAQINDMGNKTRMVDCRTSNIKAVHQTTVRQQVVRNRAT
jgi:hypothetical protein